MKEEKDMVLKLCRPLKDGPLTVVTIHGDTVLHMATYSKQAELVLELLARVSDDHQLHKLTIPNEVGNTILHEASTSDKLVKAAEQMLIKAPALLYMLNTYEVTPLYRSVCYGSMEMFKFLDDEIKQRKPIIEGNIDFQGYYYHKTNKTTVLHSAIVIESFDLALFIATKYENLVNVKDKYGMTALQLLACNSSAFESRGGGCPKCLNYSSVSSEDGSTGKDGISIECLPCRQGYCRVPLWEAKRKKNQIYESALELTKFLVGKDTSWIATKAVEDQDQNKSHTFGVVDPSSSSSADQKGENKKKQALIIENIAETPLFLATKYGCVEIVEEILRKYPSAVEHIDDKGRTILHIAIKYRKMEIFNIVERREVPMRRLVRKVDGNNNTILHMVGKKASDVVFPEVQNPAFQLQDNLLLFERVRKICPSHLLNTRNTDEKNAQQLFDGENEQLRCDAKDWLKRTAENCSIVAVLIATVAFAAAYTIPGGPNQNTGLPILLNRPFFVVFTMTDVLSLTFSLTSVIIFLWILTSPFRLKDFKQSLPQILMLGVTLLILSVSMMMFSFAATVILMIHERGEWTKIALYTASFFPVSIFALSYLPLYMSLMKTFNYSLKKVAMIFPQCTTPVPSWAKSICYNRSKPKETETAKSQASTNLV